MWTCIKCNEVFQNKLHVLKHRRMHSYYRPYKCHFGHCIKSFSSLSALQCHRRQHCDHRSYQCRVCDVGFLRKSHLVHHNCKSQYRRHFRCHSCSALFPRILSLANHIHAQHPQYSQYRNSSKNALKRLKKTRAAKSDDSKILLKIKAGKSMTIISPTKTPPMNESKKRRGKKKSKKKHRKEEKERRGIILSIKKGTVNLSDKKIKEKIVSEKHSVRTNGLTKPDYKLSEQKSDLKLTIKTCPDLTHLNSSKEFYKLSDKVDNSLTSSHLSVKKAHSLTDIDQMVKSGHETCSFNESDETKCRNGIVITKDKSGKFLAEQLQSSKMKKKDRDNVFDSFGDVGLWKVMPSPRTDRPVDVLKLKLSPHKPVRLEPSEDHCINYNASKYLDIPISIAKVKSDASGEDSDAMVSSPAFDKESDGGINNVNDSGIEVLSSSSCNRSNGNSVRSVALEDNSPTYFHAEDSLLSLDSPYPDSLNKSEHSICHKCGGIILEANNNTRSPGKCRCSFSNPNSPFQTPVSPLKSSAQLADSVKSQDSIYSLAHKSLSSLDGVEKGNTDAGVPCDPLSIGEKSEEDNDVMIINRDDSVANSDKKTRLKLKLRPKQIPVSPGKTNTKCSSKSKLNKFNSYGFVPEHESEKELKALSEDLKIDYGDVQSVESNLCERSMKTAPSSYITCNTLVHNDSKEPGVISQKLSDVRVIDNDDVANYCDNKQSESVPATCANLTKISKRPLFKGKKQQEKNESQLVNTPKQLPEKHSNNDKPVANKKPLFKKRTTSADEKVGTRTSVPLVKKQISVPDTFKEEKIIQMKVFDSKFDCKEINGVKNRKKSSEKVSVNLKAAKGLSFTSVDEDDSLQKFPDVAVDPPEEVHKPTTPLDLFQQQFLSFISNSINSHKNDVSKDLDTTSLGENKSVCSEQNELNDNADFQVKTSCETQKKPQKSALLKSHSSKSDSRNNVKGIEIHESEGKTKSSAKRSCSKVSNKKIVKNDTCVKSAKNNEKLTVSEEKADNANVDKSSSGISKTDSFSWLKIFSKTEESEKDTVMTSEISKDVMTDLSENLAEINKKMDVSEDDDTNSLDVDDVFDRLSSLEPKPSLHFDIKNTISNSENITSHSVGSCGSSKPYTRKQTAKRTIGRFKSKRKVDSDEEYSNNSSEAEYDPYMDSGDNNDKRRHSVPKECLRLKQGHLFDSTDSETESRYASDYEQLDTDAHSSRSRRLKKGRKSCCPCCFGSPRKRSSSQTHTNAYKLPRKHKQFVRYTLRLLELQEKVHTLFLTLFPECADLIKCSKVGTDEFELLIDEVVASLEKNTSSANIALQNGECKVDSRIGQQFSACAMNNIGMPFTTPDSTSRSCEIDLVNVSCDDKEQKLPCANVDNNGDTNANLSVEAIDKESVTIENSGKSIDTGTLWQHPSSISQTLPTSSSNSSSSLKLESNTLDDCEEHPVNEVTNDNVSFSSYTCTTVSQEVEGSKSCDILSNSLDNKNVQVMNNVNDVEFLDHAEQFSELQYFTPIDPMPAVQNEITITLDLNAVRVSLCRSPKDCIQRLHNQIIKLSKCLLPKLTFKNYFYKNIDNLEFLLDLMLETNSKPVPVDSDDDIEFSESEEVTQWPDILQSKLEILETPLIQETDTVQVNFFSSEANSKSEERESLFVKCSDLFEQQIKSQREFLKKDVFSVEEDKIENNWKRTQEVLNSINSINKMAQRSRVGRPRRDSRLRKRSADEKRTLFVQEKIQNSQNSTFVCDGPKRTRPDSKTKAGRKRIKRESSKEKFLSELNLGDTQVETMPALVEKKGSSRRKRLKWSSSNNPSTVLKAELENNETNVNDVGETECAELKLLNLCNDQSVKVETDSGLKSPDKNIFELMQPS